MPDHAPLPQTVAELHALVLEQQASMAKMRQEIAERDREIVERDQELERLKAQIDKLRRMHFGRKSEQVDRQIARARASSSGVSAAAPKEAVPPHLPREERVLEPGSTCPKCNNAMELLGEDVSEQLVSTSCFSPFLRQRGTARTSPLTSLPRQLQMTAKAGSLIRKVSSDRVGAQTSTRSTLSSIAFRPA